jgi:hypothetical protein
MSAFEISLIVLACVFGSSMLGLYLQTLLPEHHLSPDSKDTVKLATGIIATMAALLIGMLISSSKSAFDQINGEMIKGAAEVVMLDRTLAVYGPETRAVRALIKSHYTTAADLATSGNNSLLTRLDSAKTVGELERIRDKLQQLSPASDTQRQLLAQAQQISGDLMLTRWLVLLQRDNLVSTPLLVFLVAWLAIVFAGFGLFSPRNPTAIVTLFLSALSVSAAIFLILELNQPFTGFIRISSTAMHDAVAHLGL